MAIGAIGAVTLLKTIETPIMDVVAPFLRLFNTDSVPAAMAAAVEVMAVVS